MLSNDSEPHAALIHFYGAGSSSKLPRMQAYIHTWMPWVNQTISSVTGGRDISSECGNTFKQWVHRDLYAKEDCNAIMHSAMYNKIQ